MTKYPILVTIYLGLLKVFVIISIYVTYLKVQFAFFTGVLSVRSKF